MFVTDVGCILEYSNRTVASFGEGNATSFLSIFVGGERRKKKKTYICGQKHT